MHSSRIIVRSPYVCRVARLTAGARSMSLFPSIQHLPRFPSSIFPAISHETAPLFRLMDDFATSNWSLDVLSQPPTRLMIPFQPRFDVREIGDIYELRGEVPGVDSNALQVEFTDAQTLIVRGSTETGDTSHATNTQAAKTAAGPAVEAAESAANVEKSDIASTHSSSSYQKATVEDEETAEVSTSSPSPPTPVEFNTDMTQQAGSESVASAATTPAPQSNRQSYNQQSRYWISERTTGSFQRIFKFPSRINQEGVKASLKNGVLNIIIPKAATQIIRRINVE